MYVDRRKALFSKISDGAFLIPSAVEHFRASSVPLDFRQNPNLYYLSGFEEPESFLILLPDSTKKDGYESILFCRPRNATAELWDGERYGIERAKKIFGMDQCFDISELAERLPSIIKAQSKIYYTLGLDEALDRKITTILLQVQSMSGRSGQGLLQIEDPKVAIGEMRLIKSEEEIVLLKKAGAISSHAHIEAMKNTKPGQYEYQVQALIEYHFKDGGCRRPAYNSIVAGGNNATCLHYGSNRDQLVDGQLLLIDAGGEFEYYHADITRTFPIGKKYTQGQREVYEAVLKAQKECIAMIKPGIPYASIHEHASKVLIEELCRLGLLSGDIDHIYDQKAHLTYYPHGTGHFLGMDTHDVGLYSHEGSSKLLEPGMVFTIEPGLYIREDNTDAPEKYRGVGVRIEDDILVTKNGCELLSQVPKEIEEIESLRNQ